MQNNKKIVSSVLYASYNMIEKNSSSKNVPEEKPAAEEDAAGLGGKRRKSRFREGWKAIGVLDEGLQKRWSQGWKI